jgi:16S rRNA (guanine527-N7)-methyltransferase
LNKKYIEFLELLQKWNKVHSLTNIKDTDRLKEYVHDSIYPKEFLDIDSFENVLDIGSGAGFPAIPLAICYPNKQFTLVEPLIKRVSFLNIVKCELDLKNMTIIDSRVEDIKDKTFDLITSRAVMKTKNLLDLTKNLTHKNTKYLFYKGENVEDELKEICRPYKIYTNNKINYLYI